jgi:hypothetical protein
MSCVFRINKKAGESQKGQGTRKGKDEMEEGKITFYTWNYQFLNTHSQYR